MEKGWKGLFVLIVLVVVAYVLLSSYFGFTSNSRALEMGGITPLKDGSLLNEDSLDGSDDAKKKPCSILAVFLKKLVITSLG